MTVLNVNDLSVQFGALKALSNVTLTLEGTSRFGLIGPNGAGKTTMLNAIAGFVPAAGGTIELDGRDITRLSIQDRVELGLIRSFQTARLLEEETVETNILLGCQSIHGPGSLRQLLGFRSYWRWNRDAKQRAQAIEEILGLTEVRGQRVSALSSGVRRLVEIGRVLIADPKIVLLDEPAAGLDFTERRHLEQVLLRISRERQLLMVLIEHDVSIVRTVCEYTFVLSEGRLLAQGDTQEVLDIPSVRTAYFGEVIGA
jgi:branched-chain amino acid transport system ATP-binding protein